MVKDLQVVVLQTAKIAVRTLNNFRLKINASVLKSDIYFETSEGEYFMTSDEYLIVE